MFKSKKIQYCIKNKRSQNNDYENISDGGGGKPALLRNKYKLLFYINFIKNFHNAFTLSEVLITLGIIGIIASMTLPAVIGNAKKKETISKLKKSYTVLSQMVLRAQEDNGPASFASRKVNEAETKNFFSRYWLPYFNNPVVSAENKLPYKEERAYSLLNGKKYDSIIKTDYAGARINFTTLDGTIYHIGMMRWESNGNSSQAIYTTTQSIIVDLNGPKGPNTFGKDVFQFVADFDTNVVKPLGYDKSVKNIKSNCKKNSSGQYCAAKIMQDGWEIKDDYPW